MNPAKLGKVPDVRLFNQKTNEFKTYPCFDEKYLNISKYHSGKIRERVQNIIIKFRSKMMIAIQMTK